MNNIDKIVKDSIEHLTQLADDSFRKINVPEKSSDNIFDKLEYLKDFFSVLGDNVIKDISDTLVCEANIILEKYKNDLSEVDYNTLKEKLTSACHDLLREKISSFNSRLK